ncbi:MAG: sulfotransferase family 2 domain-containing protein [Rhodobacteraceae bacterium]|jgi:hypothetical protein|nr:sulfotransferase family 2 domain-containing protein [Paracoccaceae bacterium]
MTSLREARNIFNWHSGRARYIFVHIPKNAGVAVRKAPALADRIVASDPYFHKSRAYTRAVAEAMRANGEHHGFQHARWRDLHPKVTARLRAVAVVRNPWARTVSRYRFAQRVAELGKAGGHETAPSFEAFLEERHVYGGRPHYWHRAIRGWYPQTDYVVDAAGVLRADILRHEYLSDDAMGYFGIDEPLRRRNRSGERVAHRDFYDARTIQIVADWYAEDIALFDFDFDTPARRNAVFAEPG